MSRKIDRLLVVIILLALILPPELAKAEADGSCGRVIGRGDSTCKATVTKPGAHPVRPAPGPVAPGVVGPVQPVSGERTHCYKVVPQPSKNVGPWDGHADGAIYACQVFGANGDPVRYWQEWRSDTEPSAPAVDVKKLAEVATAKLRLDVPEVGVVPKAGRGVIGVPVWLWVGNPTPNTVGPITDTASEGEATVKIRARLGKIVWNMGDGTTITCGQGTPWKPSYGKDPSPTCGHAYQKIGTYTITGTVYWVVDWEGEGQHGTLTPTLTTAPVTLDMKDVQVLNVNPNR